MANNQICASCLDFSIDKVVKSKEDRKPTWLHKTDFVRQFINNTTDLRNRTPEKYDVVLKLNIDKRHAGKKMLYWAADKKRNSNFKIEDARKAYNNFENSGITTIDRNGHVTIKFCCPQVYRAKKSSSSKPHTYFRHLHFVVSDDKRTKWNPQIYTKIVVCKYDCAKTLDLHTKKGAILLNTLPSLYYDDEHIPGSHNLPHETIKYMTQKQIFDWISELVSENYPKFKKALANGDLEIRELPIITYCAHKKCNSSHIALEELLKKGFVNVNEYEGGMRDYKLKMS